MPGHGLSADRARRPFGVTLLPLLATLLATAESSRSPDADAKLRDWVLQQGYPFESHNATTDDGVMLRVFRVPRPGAPPVLMQHGVLDSAWTWVFNREFKALAFALHDAGYDVWLGNNRGNAFSQYWADGSDGTSDVSFWNFTFHDMGVRGIPAMIRTVLDVTGYPQLAYLGHSQGTAQFFIASSEPGLRDWVAERVSVFVALSPIAYLGHSSSLLLRAVSELGIDKAFEPVFQRGFLTRDTWPEAAGVLCKVTLGLLCKVSVDVVTGPSDLDLTSNIEGYTEFFPSGTSFKDMRHFAQLMTRKTFSRFDYGPEGNLQAYGQPAPPDYDLTRLAVPTALFIGKADLFDASADLGLLLDQVRPSGKLVFEGYYDRFSHITWMLGSKAAAYYVLDVLAVLSKHGPHGPHGPRPTVATAFV